MIKKLIFTSLFFILFTGSKAQNDDYILVKAGEKVEDYIPFENRYQYAEFIQGRILFRNGKTANPTLNYNILTSEMEYIERGDTLSIAHPETILIISIASDTFYYDQGYLKLIFSGRIKVVRKQYFELTKVLKKDSYGSGESNAATDSYSAIETSQAKYKLVTNTDRMFKKKTLYFIANQTLNFAPFTKKNIIRMFPQSEKLIQNYIKTEDIRFNKESDLLKLSIFLESL